MLDHVVAYYIHSDKALRDGDEVWSCVRELETTDDQFLKKVFEDETQSFTNVHRQKPDA
jgi:N-acyl-L-homoserine lactone synthetase